MTIATQRNPLAIFWIFARMTSVFYQPLPYKFTLYLRLGLVCIGTSIGAMLGQDCTALSPPLAASTTKKTSQITDEIISHGTRRAQALETLHASLFVLSDQALHRAQTRTLPQALSAQAGVHIQKTASGHGSPYIRGFTGNRTLAVIDGIVYNHASYRDGPNEYFSHIDVQTLKQVELLRGPASTLYGSQAVGGVVSVSTKPSAYANINKNAKHQFWAGRQALRFSSGDHSMVSRSEFDFGQADTWGIKLGASVKKFGDVRAAKLGRLKNTGYDEFGFDARLDAKISENWDMSIVHQSLSQDDVWRTHSTIYSPVFVTEFGATETGSDLVRLKDQARSLNALHIRAARPINWMDRAVINVAHQARRETALCIKADQTRIVQGFDSNLYSSSIVFDSHYKTLKLTYGLDLSHEDIDTSRTDQDPTSGIITQRIQGPVGDDAQYQMAGVFITARTPTQIGGRNFDLELGGRASHIHAYVGRFEDPHSGQAISFDKGWSSLSGSARVATDFGSDYKIWIGANRAFRAPNIADISRFGRSRSDEFEVASLTLSPETFVSVEIGTRYANDQLSVSLNAYATKMRDYIDTVATGRIVGGLYEAAKQNAASGSVMGLEFTTKWMINEAWSLEANGTYLDGHLKHSDQASEPLSRLMPPSANVMLEWQAPHAYNGAGTAFKPWAKAMLELNAHADRLSTGDLADTQRIPSGGTPAHQLLSLRAGAKIGDRLSVNLQANNLFNQAYRAHGSGSNEAGRHVLFGLEYQFGDRASSSIRD